MAEKTPAQKDAALKRCRVLLEELLADEYQRGYRDGIEKAQSIQRAAKAAQSSTRGEKSMSAPVVGHIYRHYKGGHYKVIAIAKVENDSTQTRVVIYQALYGDFAVWVRNVEEFAGRVEIEPGTVGKDRFQELGYVVL